MSSACIGRGPALGAVQRLGIAPLPARHLLGGRTARLASLQARASKGFGKGGGARPVSGQPAAQQAGPGAPRGRAPYSFFLSLGETVPAAPLQPTNLPGSPACHMGCAAHLPQLTSSSPPRLPQRDDDDDDAGPKQKVKTRRIKQPNTPYRNSEPQALAALNIKTPEDLEQEMQ